MQTAYILNYYIFSVFVLMNSPITLFFKNTCLLLGIILGGANSSRAQSIQVPNKAPSNMPQGSVIYSQHLNATVPPTATLIFTGQKSLYYYARKDVANSSHAMQKVEGSAEGSNSFTIDVQDQEGQCIYVDQTRHILLSRQYMLMLNDNVLVEEPAPSFNWVIGNRTKTLGKYRVQQATTTFRGRKYEVWFAPDLPLPLGPWKFGGLPGLILEAYDTDKLFVFEAMTIDLPAKVLTPVLPPTQGQKVAGWDAYCKLLKTTRVRWLKSMQAESPGVTVTISSADGQEIMP